MGWLTVHVDLSRADAVLGRVTARRGHVDEPPLAKSDLARVAARREPLRLVETKQIPLDDGRAGAHAPLPRGRAPAIAATFAAVDVAQHGTAEVEADEIDGRRPAFPRTGRVRKVVTAAAPA